MSGISATKQAVNERIASAKFRPNENTKRERIVSGNVKTIGEFLYAKQPRVPGVYEQKMENQRKIEELKGEILQWSDFLNDINTERKFYWKKLMTVKNLCKEEEETNMICPKILKVIKDLEECDTNITS